MKHVFALLFAVLSSVAIGAPCTITASVGTRIQDNVFFRSDGGSVGSVPSAIGLTFAGNFWSPSRPANAAGIGDIIP